MHGDLLARSIRCKGNIQNLYRDGKRTTKDKGPIFDAESPGNIFFQDIEILLVTP